MENRIRNEVENLSARLKQMQGKSIDPTTLINRSVQSIICGVLFGSHMKMTDKNDTQLLDLSLHTPVDMLTLMSLDILPLLRFLPSYQKKIKATIVRKAELFQLLKLKLKQITSSDAVDSFVIRYVQERGEGLDEEQLLYIMRDFIMAGSDTSSITVLWAIILLANYPDIQERLQKEIDSVVPADRLPELADKPKLRYVEAAILELMRHKTLAPNGFPHKTVCDTEVEGYFIPKNTTVCVLKSTLAMFTVVPYSKLLLWQCLLYR